MNVARVFFAKLVLRNISRRLFRSIVLIAAVGLVAAMGFLSVVDLGGLEQSMELGFERLGESHCQGQSHPGTAGGGA